VIRFTGSGDHLGLRDAIAAGMLAAAFWLV
jgi:hypothetical protein